MTDILNAINSQLTNEIEAYNIHGGNYIGFRTKPKGADQTITVSEDGLTDFGILPGTYYGSDGFEGIPEITKIYRPILSMNNYPETNPHKDDNGDGYTNLEDWIFNLYKGGYSLIDSCHNKDCCLVFPNPLFNEINLHFNPESNLNFPLKAKVYTIDGKLLTVKKNINSFEENVSVHKIRSAKWLIIEIEDAGDKVIYSGKVLVAKNLN